ncbi:MAG TPA: NAD-dependent epimerase/dehydratase family protein [Chitinophagales bacterium]|nr:NAD-dependent epimerase/dehydratase family protein [Chitinophagales bacterium]
MAKILITGAAGFIGFHVLRRMKKQHHITAIDNLSRFSNYEMKLHRLQETAGKSFLRNKKFDFRSGRIDFRVADILDRGKMEKIFQSVQPRLVIHLAAMTGIRQSAEAPGLYTDVNVQGFLNILECCRKFSVQHVLYASSSSVYGSCTDVPFSEDSDTTHPLSVYAATKKSNELLANIYTAAHGINTIGLRLFTVYGPWTRPDMATFTFMRNIAEEKSVTLFNEGNMARDFTYVDDVVESLVKVAAQMLTSKTQPQARIFNIGEGRPVNVRKYLSIIERLMGKKARITPAPAQNGEMLVTFADCSALEKFTGFQPAVKVEEGLRQTVRWFQNYQKSHTTGII